jgi:hypothetical protein
MAAVYPAAAIKAGVFSGLGVVDCAIDAGGHLVDCEAKREEPAGSDFGAAAWRPSKVMAMNPWTKEGDTVEGLRITLPIRFTWEEAPADGATKPPRQALAEPGVQVGQVLAERRVAGGVAVARKVRVPPASRHRPR